MSEFERCVQRGGLRRLTSVGRDAVEREVGAASADLRDAEKLLELGMIKRATITAYYAMFHAARAAVLARGYAEKSHYCLLVAFREFYGGDAEGRGLAFRDRARPCAA